jgi:GWxTD domain-containing protein
MHAKKITFLMLLISCIQFHCSGQKMSAYMDTKQFFAPEIGNYIEVQVQFVGHTLKYKGTEGGLIGSVGVKINFSQDTNILVSDVYRLDSPVMLDSIVEDFFDVRRYPLNQGKYTFKIELEDLNSNEKAIVAFQEIEIKDIGKELNFSGLLIAEAAFQCEENNNLNKSGYCILPRFSNFYSKELNKIPVYFEIYNTNYLADSVFGIKQWVYNPTTREEVEGFSSFSKHKSESIVPVLKTLDISNLPTGNYELNYTIISKSFQELKTISYSFDRVNDVNLNVDANSILLNPEFQKSITSDSLTYYLASLIPISPQAEQKNIFRLLKENDTSYIRKYIQAYWTNTNPANPYEGWIKYKQQVQHVERAFSTNFQAGFETDRGRVYLQYGPPTSLVEREYSPTEYPYEIWQYNKIGRFSNKRFIFYNPDLVNKGYRLLHSDMWGEPKNPGWQQVLNSRNSPRGTTDNPNEAVTPSVGGNSSIYYKQ